MSKIGIAAPEKANDYGWNEQGVQGAKTAAQASGASIEVSDGIGYENVEPVQPRRVRPPDPGRGGLVIGPVAGLVAERPGNDRGVVPVALDHPGDAADPRLQVSRVVAERALEGVRLDVRLVDHVEPKLVGQVEKRRVVAGSATSGRR